MNISYAGSQSVKLIILDYLDAKNLRLWTDACTFYSVWKAMSSKHLTEHNKLKGNALYFTCKLNTNEHTETLMR